MPPPAVLHSKRLQANWGQAPSPPARTLCARSLRSLAAPLRLVLRAAVRLRLSVGLLPTGSKSLAFRALLGRASLPQCVYMFGGSPAPCGGRACRWGPRPALQASRPASPQMRPARSCAPSGRCALRARIGCYAPAGSATLRPKVCNAASGVFRFYRRVAVQ